MAKSKESFDRRQRERAKKAKAEAKRERRFNKTDEPGEDGAAAPVDEDALLAEIAKLHALYDDEQIDFEDFDARRTELLSQLHVE